MKKYFITRPCMGKLWCSIKRALPGRKAIPELIGDRNERKLFRAVEHQIFRYSAKMNSCQSAPEEESCNKVTIGDGLHRIAGG